MAMVFHSSPSLWSLYPRVLAARKPGTVREGFTVPRIEARMPRVRVDPAHLRGYRELCGASAGDFLPIAYPHVLASGMHLAVLASAEFPVRLLGLVHVRNRIRQYRALRPDETGALQVSIEGHVETARGQEFTLHTEWLDAEGQLAWEEDCIFLARKRQADGGERTTGREPDGSAGRAPVGAVTTSFRAPAGLGLSYGLSGGDLNPIHLADLSARLFGFKAAIAHGMWSMARCAADLDSPLLQGECEFAVAFKLPIFLPAWVMLEQWPAGGGLDFCLRDSEGHKPHLSGTLRPLV